MQGTAAEWALCWMASLRNRLWRLGGTGALDQRPHLVLFLHDEVVVHTPVALADHVAAELEQAAAGAGRLLFRDFAVDFPLSISVVSSYADAGRTRARPGPRSSAGRHSPLRSVAGAAAGWWWRQEATGEHHDRARHDRPRRRGQRTAAAVRRFVGGFYLVMGGINAGISLADAETYRARSPTGPSGPWSATPGTRW